MEAHDYAKSQSHLLIFAILGAYPNSKNARLEHYDPLGV